VDRERLEAAACECYAITAAIVDGPPGKLVRCALEKTEEPAVTVRHVVDTSSAA